MTLLHIQEVLLFQVPYLITSSSDVPFSKGHYSISSRNKNFTFRYITSSSITSDSTSSRLMNCILGEQIIENEVKKTEPLSRSSQPKPIKTVKMVIEKGFQLRELLESAVKKRSVKELVIAEGCGNGMKNDLELCGFENLESIVVEENTLKNLNSLKISDNPVLKSIETENGYWIDGDSTGAFCNVKNVTITSTLIDV